MVFIEGVLLAYHFIYFFAHIHHLAKYEKKHNSDTKHTTPQDRTYCFNYLIERKHQTQLSQDKILLLLHSIFISCAKSNARIAMGMTPNCSARYEDMKF